MVPELVELPKTATGKIQRFRRQLATPASRAQAAGTAR
jgi:hypothetical protein